MRAAAHLCEPAAMTSAYATAWAQSSSAAMGASRQAHGALSRSVVETSAGGGGRRLRTLMTLDHSESNRIVASSSSARAFVIAASDALMRI